MHPSAIHCITRIKKVNEFEALQTRHYLTILFTCQKYYIYFKMQAKSLEKIILYYMSR